MILVLVAGESGLLSAPAVVPVESLPIQAQLAIEASQAEKARRSPTERKIDSQLLQLLRAGGVLPAPAVAGLQDLQAAPVVLDPQISLDLYGVTQASVVEWVRQRQGVVVHQVPEEGFLRVRIAPELSMALAQLPGVRQIRLADGASTQVVKNRSEGDITHGANLARTKFRIDGSGVKVGVLSDSVDHLALVQSTGDLPAINILPGQQGSGTGEGTAMLEIIHDLAPGAELYFATAFNGMAGFADNIRALHAAGCRIIVDDVIYFRESPFQDDLVARAVADVCAQGTLYFASAGNSGNLNDGTSGTWEGDFVDGGAATLGGRGGRVHSFGVNNYNTLLTGGGFRRIDFFWADPLGGSSNDYDVYLLDSNGNVRFSSTNIQDGDDDPYEFISAGNPGDRIVIVKVRGQARFMHLATGRGRLSVPTSGATRGHNASPVANAFGVGAVWVGAVPSLFQGGAINPGELFSSDGPRIMFYQRDGTPWTPGNFTASGGRIFNQPRLSAADGVKTATPDFEPFFGTSAAAPHAAALTALAWSYNPSLTSDQLRTALTNSAVDIEAPGYDRDSGHGLVMAEQLIRGVPQPAPRLVIDSVTLEDQNQNGHLDANECGFVRVTLRNLLAVTGPTAQGVTGRLVSTTSALIVGPRERQWPDIPPQSVSSNTVAFRLSTTDLLACDRPVTLELRVQAANMPEVVLPFTLPASTSLTGTPVLFSATDVPKAVPDESTIFSQVNVDGLSSPVKSLAVLVHLEHSYDSDVVMSLVAPDGTEVLLAANQGASDANYGLGCDQPTRFSDGAARSVNGASAPFVGAYRPQGSLSTFSGWEPERVRGVWKLKVSDVANADSGILRCWGLEVTPVLCEDGGGRCLVPPSIVSQPVGVTNMVGGGASFEVVVGGAAPFSYAWFFNGTQRIAGADDTLLVLNNLKLEQTGFYTVVVSNFLGLATSAPAYLLVATPPSISVQPSDVVALAGTATNLTVVPGGTPPHRFQWMTATGVPLVGATNSILNFAEVNASQSGQYVVAVSSPYGALTSRVATVTVLVPPSFTSQPSDASAVVGSSVAFAAAVNGTAPFSYQWYFNGTQPILNATNSALGFSSVNPSLEGTYQLEVSNIAGVVRSRAARLSVFVPAGFSLVPSPQQVAKDSTLILSSTGIGTPPLAFQWFRVQSGQTNLLLGKTAPQLSLASVQSSDSGDYFVRVTNTWGSATSPAVRVEVLDLPLILAQPRSTNVVLGGVATFEVAVQGGGSFGYQWYFQKTNAIPGATGTSLVIPVDALSREGTYEVEVSNLVGPIRSEPAELKVWTPPQITVQPADFLAGVGGQALLSVQAQGRPAPDFQWYRSSGEALPSGQGSNLTFTAIVLGYGGGYYAVASNQAGFATSTVAILTVHEPPSFVTGPGQLRVAVGLPAEFQAVVQGTGPFTYQWYYNLTSIIAGATGSTLILPAVQRGSAGVYTVEVRNDVGVQTSPAGTLTVLELPVFTLQPQDQVVAVLSQAGFSAAAEGTLPISYQWYRELTAIPGATGPQLNLTGLQESDSGQYRVVAMNEAGSVTSRVARLDVKVPATIVAEPTPAAVRTGQSLTLNVLAQGAAPLSYQWFLNETNAIPGATSSSYTLVQAGEADAGFYSVQVTNVVGQDVSTPVLIRVLAPLEIVEQPQDTSGGVAADASFRVLVSGGPPVRYQWYRSTGTPVGGATNSLMRLTSLTESMEGGYFVIAANDVSSVTSRVALLDVKVVPTLLTQPQPVEVVLGGAAEFSVQATGPGPLKYQWYFNSLLALENETNAVLSIPNAGVESAGGYSVEVSNQDGSVFSRSATLKVVVAPSILAAPQNLLAARGGAASFSVLVGGTPDFGYQWFLNETQAISLGTNAVLDLHDLEFADEGDYNVVVSNLAGMATSAVARLTVLEPVRVTQDPQPRVVIQGGTAVFSVVATGAAPIFYQWTYEGVDIVGAQSETLTLNGVTPSQEGGYAVRVYNAVSQATSAEAPLVVVQPPIIEIPPLSTFGPVGGEVSFTVSVAGTPPFRYQWFFEEITPLPGATNFALTVSALSTAKAGRYSVTISNDAGLVTSPFALLEVLDPPQVLQPPLGSVVRSGSNVVLSSQIAGSAPLTLQWLKNGAVIPGAEGPELTLNAVQIPDGGIYQIQVSNRVGVILSPEAVLTVLDPPLVSRSPLPAVSAPGGTVSFDVEVQGSAPLSYQWFFNVTQALAGAQSPVLTLTQVGTENVGLYHVVVSNAVGSATSGSATLILKDAPSFTLQPQSQSVVRDDDAVFSAQVAGDPPFHFQWLFNGNVVLEGETNLTLVKSGVKPADAGFYSLLVSNEVGRALSLPAVLRVVEPLEFINEPQDLLVATGSNAVFSASVYGTQPYLIQWYRDETNVVAEATNLVLNLPAVGSNDVAGYSIVVANELGAVTSRVARLDVADPPFITTQPLAQLLPVGNQATLSVAVTGAAPFEYQWYRGATSLSGATNAVLVIPDAQVSDTGLYQVRVRNAVGQAWSASVRVDVLALPTIVEEPVSISAPLDGEAVFSVTAAGGAPLTYQWYRGEFVLIPGATNAVLTLTQIQASDEDEYGVRVSNPVGFVFSDFVRLKIRQVPVFTLQPASLRLLPGAQGTFTSLATGSGTVSFQWFKDGNPISGALLSNLDVGPVSAADAGTYFVEATNPEGTTRSRSVTLTVLEAPRLLSELADAARPTGGSVTLQVQAGGSTPLVSFWLFNAADTIAITPEPSLTLTQLNSLQDGLYTLILSNEVGTVTSRVARLEVLDPPAIVTGPSGSRVPLGGLLSLEVEASGGGTLAYQWFFQDQVIAAATSSLFQKPGALLSDTGLYRVVVSNAVGSVTSAPVSVVVVEPPSIVTEPSDLALNVGSSGSLSVTAAGTGPLEYLWFFDGTNSIPGATNAQLSLNGVSLQDSGRYQVRVRNDFGEVYSRTALVSVLVPPSVTVQPQPASVPAGSPVDFTVQVSGTSPFSYQWFRGVNPISGATLDHLLIPAVSESDADTYSVEVRNPAGLVRSAGVALQVLVIPFGIIPPASQTVREGTDFKLSVVAGGTAPLSYQWFFQRTNAIAGGTNAVLDLPSILLSDSGIYTVSVSNSVGGWVSPEAIIEVLAPPAFVTQPADQVVRTGSNAVFTALASGGAPLSYQWHRVGIGPIAGATNATLTVAAAKVSDAGFYEVTASNPVGDVSSTHALLSVLDAPSIVAVPPDLVIASGQTAVRTVQVQGSAPLSFLWFKENGSPLPDQTNASLSLPAVQVGDSGRYRLTVSNLVGAATSPLIRLTVLDAPVITTHPLGITVGQGSTATLSVRATGSNLKYQWYYKSTQLLNGQTSSNLTFAAAQPEQMGEYSVVVSNEVGTVTSLPALLRVIVPGEITGLFPFGDNSTIFFDSVAGLRYTLEYNDGLENDPWLVVAGTSKRKGTGGLMIFIDPSAQLDFRFYRLRVE